MATTRLFYFIVIVTVILTIIEGNRNLSSVGSVIESCNGRFEGIQLTNNSFDIKADIRLEHPFLQNAKGLVPGVHYKVLISFSSGLQFGEQERILLTSIPPGIFEPLSTAMVCYNSSSLVFSMSEDIPFVTNFALPKERTLNTSVTFVLGVGDDQNRKWNLLTNLTFPIRNQCFRAVEAKDGILTESDLPPYSDSCDEVFLFLTPPDDSHVELQFQTLMIPPSVAGWISVQNSSEGDPGFVLRAKDTLGRIPQIISRSGYNLLSSSSCLECKFEASLTIVTHSLQCNSTLETVKGSISRWETNAFNASNICYSILKAPERRKILLYFRQLVASLEGNSCEEWNFLFRLVDGQKKLQNLPWCNGTLGRSGPYLSLSDNLTIEWNVSSVDRLNNYQLDYEFLQPCVNRMFGDLSSGTFCNPGYPNILMQCEASYVIHVPFGYTVELQFSIFELSSDKKSAFCNQNYLEVITDKYPNSREKKVLARLCGNLTNSGLEPVDFHSPSNFMELKIATSESATSKGFCATYKAILTNDNLTHGCDYGWTSGDSFCYKVFNKAANWSQAEKVCSTNNGHLASLTNVDISALVDDIIQTNPMYAENQAFWIGANDLTYENCYEWADGQTFNYNNWFPGWGNYGGYSAQPSDDGLSQQNCVELRNVFRYPSKGEGITDKFYWNDRDCQVANPFVCQKIKPGVSIEPDPVALCNRTISLTSNRPRDVITSPNFPSSYPSSLQCHYAIAVPEGHRIVATFTDFVLEESNSCEYDFLSIEDEGNEEEEWKRCGDWESKIKLLRYVSSSNQIHVTFVSDFSHGYNGFRMEIKITNSQQMGNSLCDNEMFELRGDRCYLVVNYPETSWTTARQICSEARAQLATVDSNKELTTLHELVRVTYRYMSGEIFWVGAATDQTGTWRWLDGRPLSSQKIRNLKGVDSEGKGTRSCLAIQWRQLRNTGSLHWSAKNCNHPGRFICKKPPIIIPRNLNRTVTDLAGNLTSVNYPSNYVNNLHYTVKVQGPPNTRIAFIFHRLDVEWQEDCLYDYVALKNDPSEEGIRFCGEQPQHNSGFDFESSSSVAYLTFFSDDTISGSGYSVSYATLDLSACQTHHILVDRPIHLNSLSYPHGYLRGLDCRTSLAARNQHSRLLVTLHDLDIVADEKCINDYLEVYLESPPGTKKVKYCDKKIPPRTQLVSYGNEVLIVFHSQPGIHFKKGSHRGYNLTVEAWDSSSLESIVHLEGPGRAYSLNFPEVPPPEMNFTLRLVAPPEFRIFLRPPNITYPWTTHFNSPCEASGVVITDPYTRLSNPTLWNPCLSLNNFVLADALWSTLNVLYVHSWSTDGSLPPFYVDHKIIKDEHFLNRSMSVFSYSNEIDSCHPNPCRNGRCVLKGSTSVCQCSAHFTGLFCHVAWCDLNVCGENGVCNLTSSGYTCDCFGGFTGKRCQQLATACQPDPCLPNGQCSVFNGNFSCFCNLWYEGIRCEKYAFRIPYKPLSQRMLEEPFWLGLITVFSVLVIILFVYCIKRKFADKIEKFLMDEIERSKFQPSPPATRYSLSSNQPSLTPGSQSPQTCPKSLFSRIRRNSVLSSTFSPSATPEKESSRTFSFDDILRRVHSSKRRPNHGRCASSSSGGSTGTGLACGSSAGPSKEEAPGLMKEEEKSRILSSLVTSSKESVSRRMSLDEFFRMSERKMQLNARKEESLAAGNEGITYFRTY